MLTSSIQNSPPHVTPAKQSNVSSKYDRNTKHRRKVSLITSFQCMRQNPDSTKLKTSKGYACYAKDIHLKVRLRK